MGRKDLQMLRGGVAKWFLLNWIQRRFIFIFFPQILCYDCCSKHYIQYFWIKQMLSLKWFQEWLQWHFYNHKKLICWYRCWKPKQKRLDKFGLFHWKKSTFADVFLSWKIYTGFVNTWAGLLVTQARWQYWEESPVPHHFLIKPS